MSEPVLVASKLCKAYRNGPRVVEVLRELELQVHEGDAVAVVGDSGVGKSTLLHLLGGLDRPDSGRLAFQGMVLTPDPAALAEFRNRHVGFVFQQHHLLPELTALENVRMPFLIRRQTDRAGGVVQPMLERLGLGDRLGHYPGELSGGEQQRVAIARALVTAPALVLADEPTGNLDPTTGRRVFELLRELQRERNFALVLATHNERLAADCD